MECSLENKIGCKMYMHFVSGKFISARHLGYALYVWRFILFLTGFAHKKEIGFLNNSFKYMQVNTILIAKNVWCLPSTLYQSRKSHLKITGWKLPNTEIAMVLCRQWARTVKAALAFLEHSVQSVQCTSSAAGSSQNIDKHISTLFK